MSHRYAIRLEALASMMDRGSAHRTLRQLQYAVRLSEADGGRWDDVIERAISFIERLASEEGAVTSAAAAGAEQLILPMSEAAKRYTVLCVGHAHIDMNWMWRYDETVSITLDTFRTVLDLMDEYPDFRFSQSQASVYEMVERYDPAMLERIKRRIAEGRWEVSAATWVEADRNLPSSESAARHLLYTRRYLSRLLDLPAKAFTLDFEPDTFGHHAQVPELLAAAGVRHYYHCRGDRDDALYRWASPSGAQVLCYREPFWYLGAVSTDYGLYAPEFCRRYGIPAMMRLYGVGDHGGGPTRRDLETIREMGRWPVYPQVRFGTMGEFFALAEGAADLKTVAGERNFVFTGCYTSQSRIKMANRFGEAHLDEGERFAALAWATEGRAYPNGAFECAWRKILFNQFHDIIPGSGVIDTREHAMGIFSEALAVADTQKSAALRAMADAVDTSAWISGEGMDGTTSEGAGVGFGVGFTPRDIGVYRVAQSERGRGINRVYHVFNPSAAARTECVEITLWDWPGDARRMRFAGPDGAELRHQILDGEPRRYWGHAFQRVLVEVSVPAGGRSACILTQRADAPDAYGFPKDPRIEEPHAYALENALLRAEFCPRTGCITRLYDQRSGACVLDAPTAFFRLIDEQPAKNTAGTAWTVGRYRSVLDMTGDVTMEWGDRGPLMSSVRIEVKARASSVRYAVRLFEHARLLDIDVQADWREVGEPGAATPQLSFAVPFAGSKAYIQDIPGGILRRAARDQDVPCSSFSAAPLSGGRALMLVSDAKYGFRCTEDAMSLTCIRSSTDPDPYPEFGQHRFRIGLGVTSSDGGALMETSYAFCHPASVLGDRPRKGAAAMSAEGIAVEGAFLSAVKRSEEGDALIMRLTEVSGADSVASVHLPFAPVSAAYADTHETALPGEGVIVSGTALIVRLPAGTVRTLRVER